jgi:glycosyltransferase involved in cell wall biosynthesis
MKILYVVCYYPPLAGPGVWRGLAMTRHFAQAGHDVTVICASHDPWFGYTDDAQLQAIPPQVKVERVGYIDRNELVRRFDARQAKARSRLGSRLVAAAGWRVASLFADAFTHWAVKAAGRALVLTPVNRFDVVITSGPSHGAHLAGWLLRRLRGVRWIMDYRELWTDNPAMRGPAHLQRVLVPLERRMLAAADLVTTTSARYHAALRKGLPANAAAKVRVVPNGHAIPPVASAPPANPRLRMHFNGTIQSGSWTPELFEALRRLHARLPAELRPRVTLSGLTKLKHEELAALVAAGIIEDVGYLGHAESIAECRASDVLILLASRDMPHAGGVIPAKAYEYLAIGRHVLAVLPPDSEVSELLDGLAATTLCEAGDVTGIECAIESLIELHQRHALNPPDAVAAMQSRSGRYTRSAVADALLQQIEALRPHR